jgi:hypothetical protein
LGVKLDWQIEAERTSERAGEDPRDRLRRRLQRVRILFFTAAAGGIVCLMAGAIWLRLYTVDNKLRQDLVNTVQAETVTLRIGDFGGFLSIQRTAPGGNWYEEQSARFKRYQDLKAQADFKLTGNVIDATIDGQRGRAVIEEILDGVPYHTVWFYWRYSDGWRHVPSDYTLWGDPQTITGQVSTLNYSQLDSRMAQALAPRLDRWWSEGCGYLGCRDLQKLTVEIVPDPSGQLRWDTEKPNTLVVPSPLSVDDRARADVDVPQPVEDAIASQLAERLLDLTTNDLHPVQTADAAWLRQVTIDWLSATFVGRGDPDRISFIQSLKDHYGVPALATLAHALTPTADISIVGTALKQPLESLALDWRTFFQWRLDVEKTLLARNDTAGFQALWDVANPQALEQMRARMARPTQATPQVQAVAISPGTDGVARAAVQVTLDNKLQTVIFRLVNGAWKRSA